VGDAAPGWQSGNVPEGDVVLRTARRLHAALAGRPLTKSDLRWPTLATADLTGRDVLEVVAVGKHLLIRVAGDLTLHSHLRMDGSWHLHRTGERWIGARPEPGIRVILANTEWTAIGHQLGMLDLVSTDDEGAVVGHLGPDILALAQDLAGADPADPAASEPLDRQPVTGMEAPADPLWATWNEDEAVRRLLAQPSVPVAQALLDQRNLSGLGTLYRTEVLFLRGIHPQCPVGSVPELRELLRLARRIMQANLERVQQTTTGDLRRGREHWIHQRDRLPCRLCGTAIQRGKLGPPTQERDTYWCPHCQPS
jgi:endonuclease VIII